MVGTILDVCLAWPRMVGTIPVACIAWSQDGPDHPGCMHRMASGWSRPSQLHASHGRGMVQTIPVACIAWSQDGPDHPGCMHRMGAGWSRPLGPTKYLS